MDKLVEVIRKHHVAEQMRSDIVVDGNTVCFLYVEYSNFDFRLTLNEDGSITEYEAEMQYTTEYDSVEDYDAQLTEMFAEG